MHNHEALEAYLQKLDNKLFAIYTLAKSELMTIQDRWCSKWREGNDHGPGHIDRVLDNLAVLVGAGPVEIGELSKLDIFLAMMGIVAHDIGVINGRKDHAIESAKLINKIARNNKYIFDNHTSEILVAAIVCHSSTVVLEEECSHFDHEEPIAGQTVRPLKVAALVRLADELDEDYRRAPQQLLDLDLIPKESEPYWQFCQCIQGIKIDPPGGEILINARFNEEALRGKYDLPAQTFLEFFAEKVAKINVERVRVSPFLGSLARRRLGVRVSLPPRLRSDFVARTFYFEDDMGRTPSKASLAAKRFLQSYPDLLPDVEILPSAIPQPPAEKPNGASLALARGPTIHTKRDLEPKYPDEATRTASKDYQDALECLERLRAEGEKGKALGEAQRRVAHAKRALREGRPLGAGDVLGERYLILDRLGIGGFATVWRAKDRHSAAVVAIKVLHGHCTHDRSQKERFKVGIREMSRLEHPNIVKVLDSYHVDGGFSLPDGQTNGGYHYFVMEYVEEGDFNRAIREGRLSQYAIWKCLEGVAAALEYAHSQGIIHRDVKRENILLSPDGTAKLTDFDLARAAESSHGTKTGALGSVFYAAPETHHSDVVLDERADIHSFAMTVAFALRGQPWTYEDIIQRPKVLHALGSRSLSSVLSKAIAVKREERYLSVREFWVALRSALSPQVRKRAPAPPREVEGLGNLANLLLRAHRAHPTYKPACMLAVLDCLEAGEVSLERLEPAAIFIRFDGILKQASGSGWQPFFHLSNDGFWEFIKDGRKIDKFEFDKRRPNTRRKLLQKIDFAVIPEAHKAWWSDDTELKDLRTVVLKMLDPQTLEAIREYLQRQADVRRKRLEEQWPRWPRNL